jgi:hypothetical protein
LAKKKRSEQHGGYREEVLNTKLAELLSRSGTLSVPETILKEDEQRGRRLPDVTIGEYWGVRVILEGKIGDTPNTKQLLEEKCQERIEEGIAAITIGVIYPPELRYVNWPQLEEGVRTSPFAIKVFTESGSGNWTTSNLEGLSAVLRRAYESLVSENVVNSAVDELRSTIEIAARRLANSRGTEERLKKLLVLPHNEEEDPHAIIKNNSN